MVGKATVHTVFSEDTTYGYWQDLYNERPWKMSEDELLQGFHWARRETYSLWSIFKRSTMSFNTLRLVIPANFAYRRITKQFSKGYNPNECYRGMKMQAEDLAMLVCKDEYIL